MDIFAQLHKYDESTGYFEAVAADESLDHDGEILDFESSQPHFENWSAKIAKVTEGKSVGNVREMHGKVAAGKLTEMICDPVAKQVRVAGYAVDAGSRAKMAQGVLTGVSIGGAYGKKWDDPVRKGVIRYEAIPSEISLVDNPCNPNAFFTVVKADGAEELRKFEKIAERKDVDPKEGKDKYGDVTFADEKNKKYPLDTAKHIRAAWSYIHMPKNAGKYSAEDANSIKAKISAAWKKEIDPKGPPEAEKFAAQAAVLIKNSQAVPFANTLNVLMEAPELEKGLWTVSQFACLLEQLAAIADGAESEAMQEGDGSALPQQILTALKPLAAAFVAMASEEVGEALHGDVTEPALALAAKTTLEKRGAKHSAATKAHFAEMRKHHQAMGEHLDALQAEPGADDDALEGDSAEKARTISLQKVIAERDGLQKQLTAICQQVERFLAEAKPPKGVLRLVVSKDADGAPLQNANDSAPIMKADGTQDVEATTIKLMKAALSHPMQFGKTL